VDFDYVTLSSLNRHATAKLEDVGTPKVKCVEKTLKEIANWITVDSKIELWKKEDGAHLLDGVDWVVGALFKLTSRSHALNIAIQTLSIISAPKLISYNIVIQKASRWLHFPMTYVTGQLNFEP
jgi:tRNA threonylcarbamoyladenosine dehydratase